MFDRLHPGSGTIGSRSKNVIDKLERGFARHHGMLFVDWIDVVSRLKPSFLAKRVATYKASKSARDSVDARLMRKFAVVKIAGDLAVENGILDWNTNFVTEVVDVMIEAARTELRRNNVESGQGWRALEAALADPQCILPLDVPVPHGEARARLIGARQIIRGAEVVGFLGDKVSQLFNGDLDAFREPLQARNALVREGERSDTITIQLNLKTAGRHKPYRQRVYAVRANQVDKLFADLGSASS